MKYREYVKAESLEQAYELAQVNGNIVLGGNLWRRMQNKTYNKAIDLCDLGLDKIEEDDENFYLGAYVTLRALETHVALNSYTNGAVSDAVKSIVGVQFRNMATVGGSVWGRYGFSDVITVLMALNAKVELFNAGIMTLEEFMKFPRKTADILVKVIVPKTTERIVYLSQRNTKTDFPVLTCAVAKDDTGFSAVIGARPKPAQKIRDEKSILVGEIDQVKVKDFAEYVTSELAFGGNLRAGAEYREIICGVLVKRALEHMNEDIKNAELKNSELENAALNNKEIKNAAMTEEK